LQLDSFQVRSGLSAMLRHEAKCLVRRFVRALAHFCERDHDGLAVCGYGDQACAVRLAIRDPLAWLKLRNQGGEWVGLEPTTQGL
jgi:hypothetical protein